MTETMQRWSMDALGRDNLKLIQSPVPQPGPGEVCVRVNADCAFLPVYAGVRYGGRGGKYG